ncbi:hypothetical protein SEA_AMGINE_68 [Mycobacterium phage Amgine]|uniref:Uncharacterized protein n=1 Tax=Mycobacterium phage Amgine TaxID=2015817 RepID=A0A222ZMJ6_9CAUD|nr:hypothetical protein I5G84_gp68 [Mycobacterium phage Amgine]ASR85698.1 hypothetical protein SEA_AMGINE_68 [Mycobacterium phage Amgine]
MWSSSIFAAFLLIPAGRRRDGPRYPLVALRSLLQGGSAQIAHFFAYEPYTRHPARRDQGKRPRFLHVRSTRKNLCYLC